MSLPGAYDDHVGSTLGAHGVWPPGSPIQPGDIMLRGGDVWQEGGNILEYDVEVQITTHQARALDSKSSRTKQIILKAGVEVSQADLAADEAAKASVEFKFERDTQFVVKTPVLTVRNISNLIQIARKLRDNPNWDRDDYFIVHEVYDAGQFTFLGSRKSAQSFKFEGSSGGILKLLKAGASGELSSMGNIEVALPGAGGAVAMGLCRVKRDGSIDFAR